MDVTKEASWSLSNGPISGVSVANGLVTIQPTALTGTVTVKAEYQGMVSEINIPLTKEDEDEINQLGVIKRPSKVDIPPSGISNTATYMVEAYNKYGKCTTSDLSEEIS